MAYIPGAPIPHLSPEETNPKTNNFHRKFHLFKQFINGMNKNIFKVIQRIFLMDTTRNCRKNICRIEWLMMFSLSHNWRCIFSMELVLKRKKNWTWPRYVLKLSSLIMKLENWKWDHNNCYGKCIKRFSLLVFSRREFLPNNGEK